MTLAGPSAFPTPLVMTEISRFSLTLIAKKRRIVRRCSIKKKARTLQGRSNLLSLIAENI